MIWQAKKKKEKIPGKTPQKAAPKKGQKKFEDNKPNPKLIAKKERPQSARQDQPRIAKEAVSAAKEPPEKAEKHPEKPIPPPCVGGHANAQCDCPSCQVKRLLSALAGQQAGTIEVEAQHTPCASTSL